MLFGNMGTRETFRRAVERLMKAHAPHEMTKADLARHLGKSRPWATNFLTGKRGVTMDEIDAIAKLFGVTPESLITEQKAGSDQSRHGRDTTSPSLQGGVREERAAARVVELESVNQRLDAANASLVVTLGEVVALADDFVAAIHGKIDGPTSEARSTHRTLSARRRRRRKAS